MNYNDITKSPIFIIYIEVLFMKYISLKKIYYTDINNYKIEYKKRFEAITTKHFSIEIKQYNREKAYPAFLCYTEEIMLLVEKFYKNYFNLFKIKQQAPPILLRQFVLSSLIDEIKSTNDIEGVHSTKKQIKDILESQPISKDFLHLKSVVDKYSKIINNEDIYFNACQDIRKFYDTFALNEVLTEHPDWKPDGKIFRKDPVEITSATDKVLHQGVYPEDKLIINMSIALDILNNEEIPFLIRVICFHYFFGYLHPFYDGNGRTARFIFSYYLAKEFDEIVALRLSVIIKRYKKKYYDIFQDTDNEYNKGDLTIFVQTFLEMLNKGLKEAIDILQKKLSQLETYSDKLNKIIISDNITKNIYFILLQASLFFGEGATISEIMKTTKKSRGTIQQRLDNIPKSHLFINKNIKPYRYKLNMLLLKNNENL